MALVISAMITTHYMRLSNRADAYDLENEGKLYDTCGDISTDLEFDTHWARIYKFNAILYVIITSFICCGLTFIWLPPCLFCPACYLGCSLFFTFAAIITTAFRLFNADGVICATNDHVYGFSNEEFHSWQTDGTNFKNVFIAQAALHVPVGICAAMGFIVRAIAEKKD